MRSYLLLVAFYIFTSCNSNERSFADLNAVYDEMVRVFKTNDDTQLKEFCYSLAPTKETFDYMDKNGLQYPDLPSDPNERKQLNKKIGDNFFPKLRRVRDRLRDEGLLADLEHKPAGPYDTEKAKTKDGLEAEGTETDVILAAGNKKIRYPMGEMVKLNGKWYLFSVPNVDYSVE